MFDFGLKSMPYEMPGSHTAQALSLHGCSHTDPSWPLGKFPCCATEPAANFIISAPARRSGQSPTLQNRNKLFCLWANCRHRVPPDKTRRRSSRSISCRQTSDAGSEIRGTRRVIPALHAGLMNLTLSGSKAEKPRIVGGKRMRSALRPGKSGSELPHSKFVFLHPAKIAGTKISCQIR